MGEIDISVKNFLKINTVFAQLFSQGVYGGKVNIAPEKLQELDTAGQDAVLLSSGQLKGVERIRDAQKVSMLFDNKMAFQIIMGIAVHGAGCDFILQSVQKDFRECQRTWEAEKVR